MIQINCKKIGAAPHFKASAIGPYALRAAKSSRVEKPRRQRGKLIIFAREDGALQFFEPQVQFKLTRILKQIYLRVAVRAERDPHLLAKKQLGGHDAVAKVSLCRRAC